MRVLLSLLFLLVGDVLLSEGGVGSGCQTSRVKGFPLSRLHLCNEMIFIYVRWCFIIKRVYLTGPSNLISPQRRLCCSFKNIVAFFL